MKSALKTSNANRAARANEELEDATKVCPLGLQTQ